MSRASTARRSRFRVGGVLAWAALAIGCGDDPDPRLAPIATPPAPAEAVGPHVDLRERMEVVEDLLAELVGDVAGRARRGEVPDATRLEVAAAEPGRAVALVTRGGRPAYLEWATAIDPDAAYEIELAFEVDVPGHLRLLWRAEGQAFDLSSGVNFPAPVPGAQTVRRVVRGKPGFEPGLVEMRLQFESARDADLAIERLDVRGYDPTLSMADLGGGGDDDESTPSLLALRFGSEVRPAFLLHEDEVRSTRVPAGDWRLRGAAVHPGARSRTLEVEVDDGVSAPARHLFELPVVVAEPGARPVYWQPTTLDLRLEREATIRYRVHPDAQGDGAFVVVAPMRPTPRRTAARGTRALLVSLDTVRRDVLGLYGAPGDPSPRLDRLARRAVVFDHAWSTSSWTLPAHMSMLTGLWPARHGVEGGTRTYARTGWTLARTLREAGYWTEAWTEGGFVDARFGFAHGFDRYVVLPSNHMMGEALRGSVASFADLEGPGFLFFHTYQAHAPYEPDRARFARYAGVDDEQALPSRTQTWAWMESWRATGERLPEDQRALLWHAYRAGIPPVDARLGRLLDELDVPRPETDDVVIVTSDHGETFQETSDHLEHGAHLYAELLAVPLVVASGRMDAGERRAEPASIADVPATMLALLGEAIPETDGRPLLVGRAEDGEALGEASREGAAGARRRGVRAGVQPPFEAEYRAGLADGNGVAVHALGAGTTRRHRLGDDLVDADDERSRLSRGWAADHRGRTELDFRFVSPQGEGEIRLEASVPVVDALLFPSVAGAMRRVGERGLAIRLVPGRPTPWLRVLVETEVPGAGWRIEAPAALGPLSMRCGDADPGGTPEACFAALERTAPAPETLFAESSPGTLAVRRYPGEAFLGPGGDRGAARGSLDPALARQLEALGYAGVEVGGAGGGDAEGVGSSAAAPGQVALVRTPGDSDAGARAD